LHSKVFSQGSGICSEPGDSLAIICPNRPGEVDQLVVRLKLDDRCDQVVELSLAAEAAAGRRSAKVPDFLPSGFTLRELLTWHVDIRSVPKKVSVRVAAIYIVYVVNFLYERQK
jgi:sulfite reductase alpha subunit-like flavoprotein